MNFTFNGFDYQSEKTIQLFDLKETNFLDWVTVVLFLKKLDEMLDGNLSSGYVVGPDKIYHFKCTPEWEDKPGYHGSTCDCMDCERNAELQWEADSACRECGESFGRCYCE
jgi:hypothetical protein